MKITQTSNTIHPEKKENKPELALKGHGIKNSLLRALKAAGARSNQLENETAGRGSPHP
jgi:hypothetical protein